MSTLTTIVVNTHTTHNTPNGTTHPNLICLIFLNGLQGTSFVTTPYNGFILVILVDNVQFLPKKSKAMFCGYKSTPLTNNHNSSPHRGIIRWSLGINLNDNLLFG
jgi:hypothetical protein